MPVLIPLAVRCPDCETEFRAATWSEPEPSGAMDTDLYPHDRNGCSLSANLALCPHCGHVDYLNRFPNSRRPPGELPPDGSSGGTRYRRLVERMLEQGDPPLAIADPCLLGAWCARSERDRKQEAWLQAGAVECFERAWNVETMEADRCVVAYLTGELCRRLGRFEAAEQWWQEAERQEERPAWLDYFLAIVRPLAAARSRKNAVVKSSR